MIPQFLTDPEGVQRVCLRGESARVPPVVLAAMDMADCDMDDQDMLGCEKDEHVAGADVGGCGCGGNPAGVCDRYTGDDEGAVAGVGG